MSDPMIALVRKAVAGDRGALRELLDLITPAVQASVGHTVRRYLPGAVRQSASQEVEDLTQEVLLKLFAEQGKRLLLWDPGEGLALARYVELLSQRIVISVLRSHRRNPWSNEPLDPDDVDQLPGKAESPERLVERKELHAAVLAGLRLELSPKGRAVLQLHVIEDRPVDEVSVLTSMTPNAIHVWRSRIIALARDVARRLLHGELSDD
jgi:RNA polymerase sigma factor (sigma-70 family)